MHSLLKKILVLSALIGLAIGSPIEDKDQEVLPSQVDETKDYRLNGDVIPELYTLQIAPYFEDEPENQKVAFTFDGVLKLTLKANGTGVREIVLHANDLEISTYSLTNNVVSNTGLIPFDATKYDPVTDKWTITLDNDLPTDRTTELTVSYKGFMRDDMHGFYKSFYMENGAKKWMGTTQFQQTEARRAFPCLDEPGFRARFKLTIIRPLDKTSISNTNIESTSNQNYLGKSRGFDVFKQTPAMPTYLLAFIVSNYDSQKNGTFGVYARPAAKPQLDLALRFGQQMLTKLGDYLGIDYYSDPDVEKMDMAAIPDFSAGAMENWGLLTYRETRVLYYSDDTPSIEEQRIMAVIAHEQLHQWFGDLVTCKWWSETWLNEGFARYFQFYGTEMIEPTWDLAEQFVVENLQQSMQLDSTDDTHAMTNPNVTTKAQASGMFDSISYSKAASIIRMLKHYLKEDKFKATLIRYLADNKGKAVIPDNLFTAIDVVNPNANVSTFWSPWTSTPGFPLVTVKLENKTLTLSQKRYMRDTGITHAKTELYNIPISVAIDSENYAETQPDFVYMIENGPENKKFELAKKPQKYYILNKQQTGYYRVNYDEENWKNIKEALFKDNQDGIHVLNRAQIVDDLFSLSRSGIVKYSTSIDIIRYLKKEKHYIPWFSAFSQGLLHLSQRVSSEKDLEVFSWFIKDLTEDIYKQLKFEEQTTDRRTDIYNRANILNWACKYGNEECIKLSKEVFAKYKATPTNKVPKNHRSVVYCNAVRYGSAEEFNFLFDKFVNEDISQEQLNILIGTACTKDKALANKYLDRVIKSDDIRPQDLTGAINNILNSNPEGVQFLYDYITANHTAWSTKMKSLATLSTLSGRFTTAKQFEDYNAFLTAKKTELGTTYDTLFKSMTASKTATLDWDAKYLKEFIEHLNEIKSSAPVKAISIVISILSLVFLFIFN